MIRPFAGGRLMREFAGEVAVVTGAAGGSVRLAAVEEPPLEAAVPRLRQQELDVLGVVTDVSKAESVEALARETLAAYGKVHVLCNNAGVGGPTGLIWDM